MAAVILAAGRSSRFKDGHKLLAEIDGTPIVRHVCTALAASNVDEIILVTAGADDFIAKAAGTGRWRTVENPNARDGLSTSLRTGLENISPEADGILVALADMPGIEPALVNALISAFTAAETAIVFPASKEGRRGHPVIWPKSLFGALSSMTGDTGGKTILADHKNLWRAVPCENKGAFADIDTRADFEAFTAENQPTRRK
ncbi:MAG: nucleotidyltransferase family protein [Proteobacteria bacterium]|nr:nucleotidyltransferase family protein [Pseudomonadota bacterium]